MAGAVLGPPARSGFVREPASTELVHSDRNDLDDERSIRERAYFLWEQEGRPEGRAEEHWHQARRELAGLRKGEA
jgi:hypothetical protein